MVSSARTNSLRPCPLQVASHVEVRNQDAQIGVGHLIVAVEVAGNGLLAHILQHNAEVGSCDCIVAIDVTVCQRDRAEVSLRKAHRRSYNKQCYSKNTCSFHRFPFHWPHEPCVIGSFTALYHEWISWLPGNPERTLSCKIPVYDAADDDRFLGYRFYIDTQAIGDKLLILPHPAKRRAARVVALVPPGLKLASIRRTME